MSETLPEKWPVQAAYDLATATAMLDSQRYLYVLFCCQQALEKMLKGIYSFRKKASPLAFTSSIG